MSNITYDDIVPSRMSESDMVEISDGIETNIVDMKVVTDLIDDASSYVDGYCIARFSDKMPWNPVPRLIKDLTLDVFVFKARSRGPRTPGDDVMDIYKMAHGTLEKIAAGKLDFLSPDTGTRIPENPIQHTSKTKADMKFHQDNIPGYFKT